jgi:hypothetical protein
MEYLYVLITAWSLNKINFCEIQVESNKPSFASALFSKLSKKVKSKK